MRYRVEFLLKCIKDGKNYWKASLYYATYMHFRYVNHFQVSYTLRVMTAEVQVLEMEPATTFIPTLGNLFLNHLTWLLE